MNITFFEIKEDWQKNWLEERLGKNQLQFSSLTLAEETGLAKHSEAVGVFVNSGVDAKILDQLPNLKLIVTLSTGFDHIDIAECKKRGIAVCNVPAYGEQTVAEFAFALILALSRKIYPAVKRVKEQGLFSTDNLRGFDLLGKTLGVVGTGRIGARVVKIASGFGMKLAAYDPYPNEALKKEFNLEYFSLQDLLKKSDIVTVHVPYSEKTHHLINAENFELIKPGALLINTARGAVVDTQSLIRALHSGKIAGAGLDVLEEEGAIIDELNLLSGHPGEEKLKAVLADHELMRMDNVLVTPHNAFNTQEALTRIMLASAENIESFASGSAQNVVNK